MKWDEKYSVGVNSIDDQHKTLFRLLEKLFDALKSGVGLKVTIEIITELENYAITHFHKEEYFFKQFNYAGAADHIKEHRQFVEKVDAVKADAKAGKIASTFDLINFLKSWTEHHILVIDMQYSKCFQENGLR